MEATASTMPHSYGLGPRSSNLPHGAQAAPGPHQPTSGPTGAPGPEEPHHKPFFYVQQSQPYMPVQGLQWPMPVPMPMSYNPYYGYPGLGYGMPMMPGYQQNPYMEPPGFVVPHTHLHLMDYRRLLNPQYYQTMAYHSRRYRYQHNGQTRVMTSSEVQTEPLSATQRTSTPGPSATEASLGLPDCSSTSSSAPTSQHASPATAVQNRENSLEQEDTAPPSTRMSPNGGFVIQTEEVRIECCTTPAGLQLLHSRETAEVSHSFSQDLVQCSSVLQGHVLQDQEPHLPADPSDQALQACPDILLVGTPGRDEKIPALEEASENLMDHLTVDSQVAANADVPQAGHEKDRSTLPKNLESRAIHLPFDPEYLDELRKMESMVWSMEDTLISSPELLIQNDLLESYDEMLAVVAEEPAADALMLTEEVIGMTEMPSLAAGKLDVRVLAVEGPEDETLSKADVCPVADAPAAEETPVTEATHVADVDHAPYLRLLDNPPLKVDGNQHGGEANVEDHQDTSFESLPASLPSTSWLADIDNVYYCSQLPLTPKKQSRPVGIHGLNVPSRRRKLDLDLDYQEPPTVRKPKEKYKPKGKGNRRSLSDHECCLSRGFNENVFVPQVSKRDRLCTRCLAQQRMCATAGPATDGQTLKRKAAPFQQRNETLVATCETCKSHAKKQLLRKASSPDVRGFHHRHDSEGESSENSPRHTGTKWASATDPRKTKDLKRPLASKQNLVVCPAGIYPKLREKNCLCDEPQRLSVAWERLHHCPHGNTIRERDENCALPMSFQEKWRNTDHIYLTHRWQTGEQRVCSLSGGSTLKVLSYNVIHLSSSREVVESSDA